MIWFKQKFPIRRSLDWAYLILRQKCNCKRTVPAVVPTNRCYQLAGCRRGLVAPQLVQREPTEYVPPTHHVMQPSTGKNHNTERLYHAYRKQECSKNTDPVTRLLVKSQNPNANLCWPRGPRVPTKKTELIAAAFFELSCNCKTHTHTHGCTY